MTKSRKLSDDEKSAFQKKEDIKKNTIKEATAQKQQI